MAEGSDSGSAKRGGVVAALVTLTQQWQVIVAAIAAVTALWFGFDDQRRKQLDINRAAVQSAKTERLAEFIADPHSTLVEFRATYPEHAFCAALGYYVAEAGRLATKSEAGRGSVDRLRIRQMNDAIGAQIERLAAQGGSSLDDLKELAVEAAGEGGANSGCPRLGPNLGLRSRATMWPDCRLLLSTFVQAECQTEATRLAAVMPAGAAGGPAAPDVTVAVPGGPAPPEPAPQPDASGAAPAPQPAPEPAPPPAPAADSGPGPACGAAPPTIFVQYVSGDGAGARRAAEALAASGWAVAGVEHVADGRTRGDVRYYWDEQAACARRLAEALGAAGGGDFGTISLAGRYRNLPRGQMEVWLP